MRQKGTAVAATVTIFNYSDMEASPSGTQVKKPSRLDVHTQRQRGSGIHFALLHCESLILEGLSRWSKQIAKKTTSQQLGEEI